MMLGVVGWEELFIEYQREILYINDILSRRCFVENIPITPPLDRALDPFRVCSLSDLRLLILGQDPYKIGATGLAFSVEDSNNTPSLNVISSWLGIKSMNGNLTRWAKQGVLLLNAIPTMELCDKSISHRTLWESFIRGCLTVCSRKHHVVFLVLGSIAEEYIDSIVDVEDNLVLIEKHPAYYARCNIYEDKTYLFEQINSYLSSANRGIIDFYE